MSKFTEDAYKYLAQTGLWPLAIYPLGFSYAFYFTQNFFAPLTWKQSAFHWAFILQAGIISFIVGLIFLLIFGFHKRNYFALISLLLGAGLSVLSVSIVGEIKEIERYDKLRSQINGFAITGTSYVYFIEQLLIASALAHVNSSSWALLHKKLLINESSSQGYLKISQADEQHLEAVSSILKHNNLLKKYFHTLEKMSSPNAIELMAFEKKEILLDLQNHSNEKIHDKTSRIFKGNDAPKEMIDNVHAAVRTKGKTIKNQLIVIQDLLMVLNDQIKHSAKLANIIQENLLIIEPYESEETIKTPKAWVADRLNNYKRKFFPVNFDSAVPVSKELISITDAIITSNYSTIAPRSKFLSIEIEALTNTAKMIYSTTVN